MTNLELVLNMLAEATTTEISKQKAPKNLTKARLLLSKVEQLREIREKRLRIRRVKKLLVRYLQKNF